jgi:hypothetical protein
MQTAHTPHRRVTSQPIRPIPVDSPVGIRGGVQGEIADGFGVANGCSIQPRLVTSPDALVTPGCRGPT